VDTVTDNRIFSRIEVLASMENMLLAESMRIISPLSRRSGRIRPKRDARVTNFSEIPKICEIACVDNLRNGTIRFRLVRATE